MNGVEWEKCVKIWSADKEGQLYSSDVKVPASVIRKRNMYLDTITAQIRQINNDEDSNHDEYNIWYDSEENMCFSGCQFNEFRLFGKDQHFYTTKKDSLSMPNQVI